MDAKFFLGIGLAVVLVFCGAAVYSSFSKIPVAASASAAAVPADHEILYQVSTIDALMQGVYEGVQPVGELRKHGNFGIGTFEALDGEMIVLDGKVYQAKADGRIYPVTDTTSTPFATITFFERDISATTDRAMNFSEFSTVMSGRLPTQNMIYAVRMHGTFPQVKVRAIPAQQQPYPSLTEAATTLSIFLYNDTTGTVVGFYTPVFFKGLNVAGYHLHFISDDRLTGGHILDLQVPVNTTAEYDITPAFAMPLPTSGAFTGVDLSQDLSKDLAKVEK